MSPEAFLLEPRIDWVLCELPPDNGNMLCVQKFVEVSQAGRDRMATPHRARVAILEEMLLIEALELIWDTGNGNVHKASELEWVWQIGAPRLNTDSNVGSFVLKSFQQRRK